MCCVVLSVSISLWKRCALFTQEAQVSENVVRCSPLVSCCFRSKHKSKKKKRKREREAEAETAEDEEDVLFQHKKPKVTEEDPDEGETIQYNTIQYNTIQYNTIQYNTIQYIHEDTKTLTYWLLFLVNGKAKVVLAWYHRIYHGRRVSCEPALQTWANSLGLVFVASGAWLAVSMLVFIYHRLCFI